MPLYANAQAEHYDVLNQVMKKWHAPLTDAGVQVQLVIAFGGLDDDGESQGPAIKVNGQEALASSRILSLKDRLLRRHDAEIMIDGDRWPGWHTKTRIAILDHELTHLTLNVSESSHEVKLDDLGRPRLKMRKHDFQVGWFHEVAERHGKHSAEVIQFRQLMDPDEEFRQLYLPFVDAETVSA